MTAALHVDEGISFIRNELAPAKLASQTALLTPTGIRSADKNLDDRAFVLRYMINAPKQVCDFKNMDIKDLYALKSSCKAHGDYIIYDSSDGPERQINLGRIRQNAIHTLAIVYPNRDGTSGPKSIAPNDLDWLVIRRAFE